MIVDDLFPVPQTRPIACGNAVKGVDTTGTPLFNDHYAQLWDKVPRGGNAADVIGKGYNSCCIPPCPSKACFTLPKMQTGRGFATVAHWHERRSLSIGEAKRIGGFPDEFVLLGNYSQQWSQIGNSVPPLFLRALAIRIKAGLAGKIMKQQFGTRLQKITDYPAYLEAAWQEHLRLRLPDAPTVVSLFAGCGGSSLGYSMAGFHELLAVEWDKNACATFRLNFPNVPIYEGDICQLTVAKCLQLSDLQPGELDVLDGSPPCQGFSSAGKRDFNDVRNQLFREYVRLLRGLQPKVFVMENVSGLVKGKMKLIFAEMLCELKASGYQVAVRLLNAMYFGVPQSRQRIIFIGLRNDLSQEPNHPSAEFRPITAQQAIADLPEYQVPAIQHIWIDESPVGRNTKTWHLAQKVNQGQCYAGQQRRILWNQPFPTITKPSSDGMGISPYLRNSHCHPLQTRTLSVRELARGTSYPDYFSFLGMDGANRIGNSVPPLFMRAIANHIRNYVLTTTERQIDLLAGPADGD